jgi:hypothetical protein
MSTDEDKPKKKKKERRVPKLPALAMTLQEFCDAHRISLAFFYELKDQGLAPDVMELGGARRITVEAAARWREKRTAASTEKVA